MMRRLSLAFALLFAACGNSTSQPPVFDGGPCGGFCAAGTTCVDNVCVSSSDAAVDVPFDNGRRDAGRDAGSDSGPTDVGFDVGFDVVPDGCAATTAGNCCGVACAAVDGGRPFCGGGVCGFTCNDNLGDCDGNAANGCETSTSTSDAHCGACGHACSTPGQHCVGGACACPTGQAVCNGRCVNTNADIANCGGCGMPCMPGRACVAGACVACTTGQAVCSSACVDNATDVANCGSCGYTCPAAPVGATAQCVAGVCGFSALSCPAGTGNCDARDDNGCETTTTTNLMNCGLGGAASAGCGHACPSEGGTASCTAGVCAIVCDTGRASCDGDAANGCETDTTTSSAHCGACGHACLPLQHCAAGACVL